MTIAIIILTIHSIVSPAITRAVVVIIQTALEFIVTNANTSIKRDK